jgi:hypothetical protein
MNRRNFLTQTSAWAAAAALPKASGAASLPILEAPKGIHGKSWQGQTRVDFCVKDEQIIFCSHHQETALLAGRVCTLLR